METQSLGNARYEAVIKVACDDPADLRARDIEEGIGYACALLVDEYGRSANEIERLLQSIIWNVSDRDGRRNDR
jgi:hypothetical protein